MLNEQECRRPDFRGGTPVKLADGQEWSLARPVIRFVPDDGPVGFATHLILGDDYPSLLKALMDAIDAADGPAKVAAELALARRLLLTNYDLPADALPSLVQFGYDADEDPEGYAIRSAIMDVAMGRAPKA